MDSPAYRRYVKDHADRLRVLEDVAAQYMPRSHSGARVYFNGRKFTVR